MIGAHQYSAAISVAIQYLRSYSHDNEGRPFTDIQNWPIKKKVKKVTINGIPAIIQEEG
jgi:hypothetical protein